MKFKNTHFLGWNTYPTTFYTNPKVTMSVIIHLDSSYVGFIFLIITELLLVRVVVSSQIKSLDREVKDRLDDDQTVELGIKEYGPLKITTRMGFSKILLLVFPAAFILLLVASSELGISGRTLQTYSVQDTILSGGYFSLDSIKDSWDYFKYDPSPPQYIGKWSNCVDFNNNGDSIVSHKVLVSYEIIGENLELRNSICSSKDDVVISNLKSQCYEDDDTLYRFDYEVVSKGDLIYKLDESRLGGVFGRSKALQVSIWMGEAVSGECLGESGGPGKIFFVDTTENVYTIIDDSWRIGNSKERWIVHTSGESLWEEESWNGTIQGDFTSVVECEKGCFEAIVEWLLSDGFDSNMESVFSYLTIWYEGLNYATAIPICERNPHHEDDDTSSTNWLVDVDNLPFKTSSCDDVVSQAYIPDGGEENITEISIWAVLFLAVSFFFTFLLYLFTRKSGYDLLSYEGISRVCYEDSHMGNTWTKGGALSVRKLDGKITSRV